MSALAAQQEHYQAVRSRLMNPPKKPMIVQEDQTVLRQREELRAARERIAELEKQNEQLAAQAGDYCRTLMHYLCQKEEVEPIDGPRRSVRKIINEVLRDYPGISVSDVLGPRRMRHIIEARFAAIWAVKKERPDLSYPQIGRAFNRDHTTILAAVQKMQEKQVA